MKWATVGIFLALQTSYSTANVKCNEGSQGGNGGQFCPNDFPICCGDPLSGGRAYCYKGGFTCCDNDMGRTSGGCMEGRSCCKYGFGQQDCCTRDQVCTEQGCRADVCTTFRSPSSCIDNSCQWCCGSNKCGNPSRHDLNCEGDEILSSRNQTCNDICNLFSTCDTCRQNSKMFGCGWCCSTGTCMNGNMSDGHSSFCSAYSFLGERVGKDGNKTNHDKPCDVCGPGGEGVVTDGENDSSEVVWVGVVVILPLILICVIIAITCMFTVLGRNRARAARGGVASAGARRGEGTDGNYSFDLKIAAKYNFPLHSTPEEDPPAHSPSPPQDECVACFDSPGTCVFLPCNHSCCCAECALRLEETHHAKQTTSRETTTYPLCPLCREEITHMINTEGVVVEVGGSEGSEKEDEEEKEDDEDKKIDSNQTSEATIPY